MSLKTLETKRHIIKTEKSADVDTSLPGLINIDDREYCIEGTVAKFILELAEELEVAKKQLVYLEELHGESGQT
jgi:hypothetical protein